jgi:uncharacterized membrane protein YraQ (UPF0718 family)
MKQAFKKAIFSLISVFPMIVAVVGLVGLFQIYITPEKLSFLFGKGDISDTFAGTLIGAISVGHGMISYVVAEGFLQQGISLYGTSAFILAWVTLGFIQLPAESSVFGIRFTIYRNLLTLISTILVTYFTIKTIEALS